MAKVQGNLVIHGLSGMLGRQLVVRRRKNGQCVLAAAPSRHAKPLPDGQKKQCDKFRQAVRYAKGAQATPAYRDVANARGISAYNVAIADFLHPPQIQAIDLSGYTGAANESITITAVDDVKVKTVSVVIRNDDGTAVEQGAAVMAADSDNHWLYTTRAAARSPSVNVVVQVADLTGQTSEASART